LTKPSRRTFLFLLTVGLCFAIGYGIGAFPDRWQKLRGKPSETLVVLSSSHQTLPDQFLLDFEKATGQSVEIKVIESYHLFRTEAGSADLLFAPLAWLGNFPEILMRLPDQANYEMLLSSDFQSLPLELKKFLPVLWKTESKEGQTHLMIWGFSKPQNSQHDVRDLLNFLLTSDRRARDWAKISGLNSTLQKSNTISDFPENQKAQKIRDVALPNLVIDQKLSN
jgi:hypothetical protein